MYYKKRPELMKLVEELYRAYRALAERYDHATGALRHAHRTMSEAFPNHIPLALPDESLSNSTPETPSPRHALFDFDDLPKDTFGPPMAFKVFDRKEAYPEENEALATKKGSRQFNEMFIPRVKLSEENDVVDVDAHEEDGVARVRIPERKVRKSLNFEDEEGNTPNAKIYIDSKNQFQQEHKENPQEQISQLSSENQKLKDMIELESKQLDLSREEVQNFRNLVVKLESEKDAALLKNQSSNETISNLEIEIFKVKDEIGKSIVEMEKTLLKLSGAETQCVELEKANQSLQFELEEAKLELEEVRLSLTESKEKHAKTEMALQSSELLYKQSNENVMRMTAEIQILVEKVKEIEHFKVGLEDEIRKLKDMNCTLSEHNSESALKVTHLEAELIALKEINRKLEDEVEIHARSKEVLQEELDSLKDNTHEMDLRYESLTKQMEELRLSFIESKEKQVKTEMALQSREQLYDLSNDKIIVMTLEIQILVEKLKEIELLKVGLGYELHELEVMNNTLSEHNSECALKIMHLEGEIISLKEIIAKLEDDVDIHLERKKVLQQELDYLKDNKNEIDLKHQSLTKEMEEASLHTEFLDTLVKKLQSGHDELEECCGKLEVEKVVFRDKLKDMESVLERNSALEKSLSEANLELEELRERIKVLEGSCESINAAISTHIGEKTALASEVEILAENLVKLSVESTLLESSLDGANTELEELRSKLRVLEELHESLCHEKLDVAQKNDLLSQVENYEQILGNLEATHASLEEKNLNLLNEKDLSANRILMLENSLSVLQKEQEKQPRLVQENRQVNEKLEAAHQQCFSRMAENIILQGCLYDMSDSWIVEEKKYMSLVQSKEIQLFDLESQIHDLQHEIKVRDSKLEEEEQKSMNSMLEIFILHECLSEMKGGNFSVLLECQKLQEASRSVSVLIKQLEVRDVVQKQNIGILMEKLFDLENENVRLRTNLKELSPLFSSAGYAVSDVEEHVHQLAKLHGNPEHHETSISDHDHSTMAGVVEMQNLIAKVQSLQELIVDTKNHLDHEKLQSVANLESARREIEELKLKESSMREEKRGMESSPNMVKDIELDQVSNSRGVSRIQSAESNDQMLKLWETPNGDLENRISTDHHTGATEEVKGEKLLSDLVAEKDIRVQKHETSREIKESQDEWNRMVIKRLATDANMLLALQNNAHQLKLKMESSGMSRGQNRLQFDTLRAKLKDAEAAIFDLLDRNGKSTMMAEIYADSCSGEEMGSAERDKVLEQVRNASKRIEMVELELEKIDYIFLKLEEECESYMTRGGEQTPRMLLRDYLYGRRHEKGKKRGRFCLCARPRTLD